MEKEVIKLNLDALYINEEAPWGTEADPLVKKAEQYFTGNTILDLGVGDGRNALFLAQQGFKIIAVDLSTEAIAQLDRRMKGFKSSYVAITEDIAEFDFPEQVDNIICALVLHYLDHNEAENVLHEISESVSPNGIIVLESFTDRGQLLSVNSSGYWPKPRELVYFFESNNCETIYYDTKDRATLQQNIAGESYVHEVESMIFKCKSPSQV